MLFGERDFHQNWCGMMKVNPRRIPKTQADVERAYSLGRDDGTKGALTIMLYTLKDKYGWDDMRLQGFSEMFNYTVDSISRGYITESDLKSVIKVEYGLETEVV